MTFTDNRAEHPDTYDMALVHNCFRRNFAALPELVAAVGAKDAARAGRVVEFLRGFTAALHHHHSGEDELMWPVLLQRVPTDSATVLRMEEQHERMAELIGRVESQATDFAAAADPIVRDRLASTLATLSVAVDEHLTEEETEILPIVERVMTVPEWEAIGDRGRSSLSKARLLVFLGYILHEAPADQKRRFLAAMPVPARLAWRLIGRHKFANDYRAVFGTNPASARS